MPTICFLTNSPPLGPTRSQIPDKYHNYNNRNKIHKPDGFHPQMTLSLPSARLFFNFATNAFQINELKAEWYFNKLLELHYHASRGYIFAV